MIYSLPITTIFISIGLVYNGLVNTVDGRATLVDRPCLLRFDSKFVLDPSLTESVAKSNLSDKKNIEIPNGKRFRLDCSEQLDILRRFEVLSLDLECRRGNLVTVRKNQVIRQGDIDCVRDIKPRSQLIRNGTCHNNATKIDVYFGTNVDEPYVLYSVCHDEKKSVTLYSQSFIDGKAISEGHLESGSPRPPFKDTDFFPFDVNQAYKRDNQAEALSNLLGSEEMVNQYIPNQQYYFSRGHLYPNGDPIYKYQKDATFYYINAVPQWQVLNGGNWERVESSVRNLAKTLESKLKVWTGTYGVLQLNDANNNPVDLWMKQDEVNSAGESVHRLPVPKFMWKVVYDETEKAAVAVVQINNPWQVIITKHDLLCTDICDKIPWIRFDTTAVKKGYTYCCDVNALKKTIEFVPTLDYSRLLDYEEKSDNTSTGGTDEEDEGYSSEESDESSSSDVERFDPDFENSGHVWK